MGKEVSERVRLMKKNFMQHHKEGKSVLEIADIYRLNFSTVYHNLQSIADENHVSRASLLERQSSKHTKSHRSYTVLRKKMLLSPEELQTDLSQVLSQLNETNNLIIATIKEE